MPIVTDKLAFYHCPRTGGTWVRTVFDELEIPYTIVGHQHDTPADCRVDGRLSFTIVRRVDEWLASWRALVDASPEWSWPVPDWMLNAKTRVEATTVMQRYHLRVAHVLSTENLRSGLQNLFKRVRMNVTVPDLPPVNQVSA